MAIGAIEDMAIGEGTIERECRRRGEYRRETPREGKRRGGAGFLEILGKREKRAGYSG